MQQNPLSSTKVLFVGSFDPFHEGHRSIVQRALSIFGEVVVAVAVNTDKRYMYTTEERMEKIRTVFQDNPRVTVDQVEGLTIDYCRSHGISHIIKGVRSVKDFEYEREQADINRRLTGIETVLLYAEPGMESISSSLVRELIHFGKDVSQFLP